MFLKGSKYWDQHQKRCTWEQGFTDSVLSKWSSITLSPYGLCKIYQRFRSYSANEFVIFPGAAGFQLVEGMPMHQCLDTPETPDICSTCHLMSALTVGTWTLESVNREEGGSIYVKAVTLRVAVLSSSSGFQFLFLSSLLLPNYGFS